MKRKQDGETVGFAHLYLAKQVKEFKTDDQIDAKLYTRLIKLDSKLGTSATEQLFWCLPYSLRLDLVKVKYSLYLLK